jgi:exopolysaccharide biosynthesis WecB/TagA/CpsF family protein
VDFVVSKPNQLAASLTGNDVAVSNVRADARVHADGDGTHYSLFGLRLSRRSMAQAVEDIVAGVLRGDRRRYAFVNAHCCNVMWRSADYRNALASADDLFPDGSGIDLAARLAGERVGDNLNGTDMFPHLCRRARDAGCSIFLLGARPGVAERVAQAAQEIAPGLEIAGCHHGYFSPKEEADVLRRINACSPDIVLVAMGVPAQDEWLAKHAHALDARATLGVGGLFDFYSGRIPRAPLVLRRLGLEWTFRLLQEPRRLFSRYVLGNPAFLARAFVNAFVQRLARIGASSSSAAARLFDLLGAGMGLLLAAPLMALIALAIRLDTSGPVFYSQIRVGRDGKPFKMLKFRSMVSDADALRHALEAENERGRGTSFKMRQDPRITRVGRWLRRTSLDELPQLFNVLRGDMAIVGPRPALPSEVVRYEERAIGRLRGRPGLTCIWQVSGRALVGFDEQVEMDLDYLRRRSLWLDLSLMIRTVPAVVAGRGAM